MHDKRPTTPTNEHSGEFLDPGWHKRIKSSEKKSPDIKNSAIDFFSVEKMKNPSLYGELNKLKVEYEERLRRLDQWRDREEDAIRKTYELTPIKNNSNRTFHFTQGTQFSLQGGRTACTSISCVSVYNLLVVKKNPAQVTWEKVVRHGVEIWKKWFKEQKNEIRTLNNTVEVFEMRVFDSIRDDVMITSEYHGHLDDKMNKEFKGSEDFELPDKLKVLSLSESLNDMILHDRRTAAVLTIRGISVSLYHNADEKNIWLFDSHGGQQIGKSTLIDFSSIKELVIYIHEKNPISEPFFVKTKYGQLETDDLLHTIDSTHNQYFMVAFCRKQKEE